MFGRLQRPTDFEAVLATSAKARSAHFAVYCLPWPQTKAVGGDILLKAPQLSTERPSDFPQLVDESAEEEPEAWRLGLIVPKRLARKATTRNLLRRQMRCAFERHRRCLPPGTWVLRLRTPLDTRRFRSAAPIALRSAARLELEALLRRAAS
ncbi:MAG TPA: ribonuclease P protein component [Burkholderiaceae bacterium]|nr:ribonuclease P protein component [Burkholderiaceae bacterium]